MKPYPKINTIWKRDPEKHFCIMPGKFVHPAFSWIQQWRVTEKIDGTNIRIKWDGELAEFGGRTESAQVPTELLYSLQKTFPVRLLKRMFPDASPSIPVTFFGEGHGKKIQKYGEMYCGEQRLVLFDVMIGDLWLERESVDEIAKELSLPVVPDLGTKTTEEIITFVQSRPRSTFAEHELIIEGVVCRTPKVLLFRTGKPIVWKLKVRDYDQLEKQEGKGGGGEKLRKE